jgi:hypothetical protein
MKNMFDIQKMVKAAKEMQETMEKEMNTLRIEGSSGGGVVTVTMDGRKNVISLKIDPEVVDKNEIEMLQDLIIAALNDAAKKVDEALAQKLGPAASGLKIPGMS